MSFPFLFGVCYGFGTHSWAPSVGGVRWLPGGLCKRGSSCSSYLQSFPARVDVAIPVAPRRGRRGAPLLRQRPPPPQWPPPRRPQHRHVLRPPHPRLYRGPRLRLPLPRRRRPKPPPVHLGPRGSARPGTQRRRFGRPQRRPRLRLPRNLGKKPDKRHGSRTPPCWACMAGPLAWRRS
jgi:hypothetical protein